MNTRMLSVLLVAIVALGAVAGVAATEDGLAVEVAQDEAGEHATVTVTHNDTDVEGASVNVTTTDENASYAGTGDYETDENGTVTLDAPDEDVEIEVTAEYDDATATTTTTLEAADEADDGGLTLDVTNTDGEPLVTVTENDTGVENASVNVTTAEGQNVTYVGEGEFPTDENGTVTLEAAEENVTVDVTATYGNDSVSTTVDLVAANETDDDEAVATAFGQQVREFITSLDREGGIGAAVSDFVTSNNPGNAPDHAGNASDGQGPPEHAGNASEGQGQPDHAGNQSDGGQGPPDHVEDDEDDDTAAEGDSPGNSGSNPGQGN